MAAIKCLKKSNLEIFSGKKMLKFLKVVKPVLKLMRKQRTNAVTPSACNYDIMESFQNDLNESELELFQLEFKFFDWNAEAEENYKNEQLEKRLLEKLSLTTRSDVDVCERGDEYETCRQTAERQIPVAVA